MQKKTKLLVSPKNIDEARITISAGIKYIDCKNPKEGSLGANFPWVIQNMKRLIPEDSNQLLSATIGDFPYLPGSASLAALGAAVCGADIIKVGLKGPTNEIEGTILMKNVVKSVKNYNIHCKIVAAGYADYSRIGGSPEYHQIPVIAKNSGADIAMLDTFIKDGKSLFDFLSIDQLMSFKELAEKNNLLVALAGNLHISHLKQIRQISPDIIGIRSAVCENYDRENGSIKYELIKKFKEKLN